VTGTGITIGLMARAGEVPRELAIAAIRSQIGPDDELLSVIVGERDSSAAMRNAILAEAAGEVVVFVGVEAVPVETWLEAIRQAFIDSGIDAIAGSVGPAKSERNRASRPGGRLRWTGHLVADYASDEPSTTSLAPAWNCAVRRQRAIGLGGFDESFNSEWPHEEVEFFTRLAKTGGRMRYVPEARVLPAERTSRKVQGMTPEEALDLEVRHSRSMALVFARHEAWALMIMMASHLLIAILDVFSSRLPRAAPVRIARGMVEGVRAGGRPVSSPFRKDDQGER